MSIFIINTHHAYINTTIVLKWIEEITGTCQIKFERIKSHSKKEFPKVSSTITFDSNDRIKTIRLQEGVYTFYAEYKGIKQEESIFIEDAIKIGGGKIEKSFVFDHNPWVFLTTTDRLYITNRNTGDEFIEYGVVPESICSLDDHLDKECNYFLLKKQEDYSIFNLSSGKHVLVFSNHIYSNSSLVIYKQELEIIIYDFKAEKVIDKFKGQYSFGRKFYYIKNNELYGLNLDSKFINKIKDVGYLNQDTTLVNNYIIKLLSDYKYQKIYTLYDLGNGENNIISTNIDLPYYLFNFVGIETERYHIEVECYKKYSEESKDILNKYPKVLSVCPGIEIKSFRSEYENNKKLLQLYVNVVFIPKKNISNIPYILKGEYKKTISFNNATISDFNNLFKEEPQQIINHFVPQDQRKEETLLGRSSSGNISVIRDGDKILLRNNTDNSISEVFKTVDFNYYNNAFLSSDGKYAIVKTSKEEFNLFDFEDLALSKFDVNNSTIGLNAGINGYKPEVLINSDNRKPVWVDPITLKRVETQQLSNYTFLSPNGNYFADTQLVVRYYNIIEKSEITNEEYQEIKSLYDWPDNLIISNDQETVPEEVKNKRYNREILCRKIGKNKLFSKYRKYLMEECGKKEENIDLFIDLFLNDRYNFSEIFIEKHAYLRLHNSINETEKQIFVGNNVWYLNYVSFSYDSSHLAFAVKLNTDIYRKSEEGIFGLYDIVNDCFIKREHFDNETKVHLMAVWISMFSKTNDIGYYDSTPNTYICKKTSNYKIIKITGKNLLCFSPSGKYIATSDQRYLDYTHHPNENWGHQPSGNVYIYSITDIPKQIAHFNDLGVKIKGTKYRARSVATAAFSQDDMRLLVVGDDGVVVIRNLHFDE